MLNKIAVLSEIAQSIRGLYDPGSSTFTNSGHDLLESIQKSQKGIISDTLFSGFTTELGIGSVMFNECPVKLNVPNPHSVLFINRDVLQAPGNVKSRLSVPDLKDLLQRCKIISFTDWSNVDGASDLWDRFRTDVIKPFGRNDFEFIFYVGDTANKLSYQVDEILDIMSDFSFCGKVTLIVRDWEAAELWRLLSGQECIRYCPSSMTTVSISLMR